MTKQRQPNPQPTPGVGSVIYMAPRAKEPRLDSLYVYLHDAGWRFDEVTVTWYTPIGEPVQFGRLEHTIDGTRAWLQPPSIERNGRHERPTPIATFAYFEDEHFVGWDTAR